MVRGGCDRKGQMRAWNRPQGPCNPSRSSIALKNIKNIQRFECKEERKKEKKERTLVFGRTTKEGRVMSTGTMSREVRTIIIYYSGAYKVTKAPVVVAKKKTLQDINHLAFLKKNHLNHQGHK